MLGGRGFPLESAPARICQEGGARVVPNLVRNMDLVVPVAADARRLEVVADGLPLWGGVRLTDDTTLVSTLLRADGNPRQGASTRDGLALTEARRAKEIVLPRIGRAWSVGALGGPGTGDWWPMVRGGH